MKPALPSFLALLLWAAPAAQAQFTYTTNNGAITITSFSGSAGVITIPPTIHGLPVTGIGGIGFFGSTVVSVKVPASVTDIGKFAFDDCIKLTGITVDAQNPSYTSLNGVLFDKSQTMLIQYPGGLRGSYEIPGGVTSIGQAAFQFCAGLTHVTIPQSVNDIGGAAFYETGLAGVTIPAGVTSMGSEVFEACTNLSGVLFLGNAPVFGPDIFQYDTNLPTVYYLPGTTGWGTTLDGAAEVLWNPQIQTNANFGAQSNQFEFDITGATNLAVVVQAAANPANAVWSPLRTITLTNGLFHFSDPFQTNNPIRFYRLSPF